jgi:hypothetical protein
LSGGSIGEAFGRDSRSIGFKTEWIEDRFKQISFGFHYVLRTGDQYEQVIKAPQGIRRVSVKTNLPNEHSYIFEALGRWPITTKVLGRLNAGLEYAEDFEFTSGRTRILYRLGTGLDYRF